MSIWTKARLYLLTVALVTNLHGWAQVNAPGQSPDVDFINEVPAITVSNPSLLSAGHFGYAGLGVAFQNSARVNPRNDWKDPDFNTAVHLGLGDPDQYVGLSVNINVYGLSNTLGQKENFGEGSMDIQLTRAVTDNIYIGAGLTNALQYNAQHTNALRTLYAGVSGLVPLKNNNEKSFSFLYLSAGLGNGKFQNREDFLDAENRGVNFYASASLQVLPRGNLIAEWTGADLTVAASVFPVKNLPVHLIAGLADINYDKKRYIAVISYSLLFNPNQYSKNTKNRYIYNLNISPQ